VKATFEDKVLMVIVWIVMYPDLSLLVALFGCSRAVISSLIVNALPLFDTLIVLNTLYLHLPFHLMLCALLMVQFIEFVAHPLTNTLPGMSITKYTAYPQFYLLALMEILFPVAQT